MPLPPNMTPYSFPALPLLQLTPLPNVTLYYTVYRLLSNYQAMAGAQALSDAFRAVDAQQASHGHTAQGTAGQRAGQKAGKGSGQG